MIKFFTKQLNNKKGFTLIELIVVIAILGILAAIAIPRFTASRKTAEKSSVEANLRTIDSAIMVYIAENGDTNAPTGDDNADTGLVPNYLASWPEGPGTAVYAITNNRATVSGDVGGETNLADKTVEELPWRMSSGGSGDGNGD